MVAGWALAVKSLTGQKNSPKPSLIAVSIYPLYDLVRNIAGSDQQVVLLLPPGTNSQSDIAGLKILETLSNANLVFVIGHDLDSWVLESASQIDSKNVVTVDKDIPVYDGNPYYWLSLENSKQIVENISDSLSLSFPENAKGYQERADSYLKLLDELKTYGMEIKNNSGIKEIAIPSTDWNYLARDFDLTASVSASISSRLLTLDPYGGSIDRDTYLSMMKFNLDTLLSP